MSPAPIDANLTDYRLAMQFSNGDELNYAPYLAWAGAANQTSIMENFGQQGDTATLVLRDDYTFDAATGENTYPPHPHIAIPPFTVVRLLDQNPEAQAQPAEGVVFSGICTDPKLYVIGPNLVEWVLDCVDFTYYADTSVAQGQYIGLSAGQCIVNITKASGSGIKAALVADGGYVQPGPVLPLVSLNYDQLSNHWQSIATLASQSATYGWFVDSNYNLHFYNLLQAPDSGVMVTTVPTESGLYSVSECHVDLDQQPYYEWDGTVFYTRCIVEGANTTYEYSTTNAQAGKSPTDSFTADGISSSWTLSYVPTIPSSSTVTVAAAAGTINTANPYLLVGGKATSVDFNQGTTPTTAYQIVENANGLYTLQIVPGTTVPPAGTVLKLWYTYQAPVISQADLPQSQAALASWQPNQGIFAEFVSNTALTTLALALAQANAELQEYGAPQERFTFYNTEEWVGWMRVGSTFRLHAPILPDSGIDPSLMTNGLDAVMVATQLQCSFGRNGARISQFMGVRIS